MIHYLRNTSILMAREKNATHISRMYFPGSRTQPGSVINELREASKQGDLRLSVVRTCRDAEMVNNTRKAEHGISGTQSIEQRYGNSKLFREDGTHSCILRESGRLLHQSIPFNSQRHISCDNTKRGEKQNLRRTHSWISSTNEKCIPCNFY